MCETRTKLNASDALWVNDEGRGTTPSGSRCVVRSHNQSLIRSSRPVRMRLPFYSTRAIFCWPKLTLTIASGASGCRPVTRGLALPARGLCRHSCATS